MLYQHVIQTILRINSSSYARARKAIKALTLLVGRLAGEIQSEQDSWLIGKAENCRNVCWMTMGKRRGYLARGEFSDGSKNFPVSAGTRRLCSRVCPCPSLSNPTCTARTLHRLHASD